MARRRLGVSARHFKKLNYYTVAKWSLEAVLEFHEELGIAVVDGEGAAVGLEEVVAYDGVQLVVKGVVGTEAIVNAAIGDIDIGETLQGKGVVKQLLGDTEGGEAGVTVLATWSLPTINSMSVSEVTLSAYDRLSSNSFDKALRVVRFFLVKWLSHWVSTPT